MEIRFVRSKTTVKGDDVVDHLDAGYDISDHEEFDPEEALAELENSDSHERYR